MRVLTIERKMDLENENDYDDDFFIFEVCNADSREFITHLIWFPNDGRMMIYDSNGECKELDDNTLDMINEMKNVCESLNTTPKQLYQDKKILLCS